VPIIFKGSGFYVTDNTAKNATAASVKEEKGEDKDKHDKAGK